METNDPTRPQVPNPEIAPTPGRRPEIHPAESPQINPARTNPEISREGEGIEIWPDSSPDATPQTPPEVRPVTGLS
jgi:hypothetical protein